MSSDPSTHIAPPSSGPQLAERLVLVTGAGRSGTSTVAGTLHFLGLHVPLPVIKPNESNPLGFFESTWPLWFHRRLMDRAVVEQTDGRPEAVQLMASAVTTDIRNELTDWLAEVARADRQVLVKDPRSIWVPWLWEETAVSLGMRIGFLTMVRHPAEVLGSRATYYRGTRKNMGDWQFAVMNLCAWINGNLVVERQTRGKPRVVLRYYDLVADWRSCMRTVRRAFDLTFNDDLDAGHRHRVDEFIDPTLRRHQASWEGLDMPPELVNIAEAVWDCMCRIADGAGRDEDAEDEMDRLSARYEQVVRTAQAIARDTSLSLAKAARLKAESETRERMAAKLAKARAAARAARQQAPAPGLAHRVYRYVRRRAGAAWRGRRGRVSGRTPR
jgi:hypothetical protein